MMECISSVLVTDLFREGVIDIDLEKRLIAAIGPDREKFQDEDLRTDRPFHLGYILQQQHSEKAFLNFVLMKL